MGKWSSSVYCDRRFLFLGIGIFYANEGYEGIWMAEVCILNILIMEENNNLVESFENSLLSNDKKDLIATVGDTSIDAVVSNGALDGIPILGILNGIYKVGKNVQTLRLCKKVAKFLYDTNSISQSDKERFIKEYTEINKEKGAELLLNVIDKIDNINKIECLANMMKAKVNGEISIENFVRLCLVIEKLPYVDFCNLEKYKQDYSEVGTDDILLSAGVIYNSIIDANDGDKYKLNYIGKLLLRYGMGKDTDVNAPTPVSMPNMVSTKVLGDTLSFEEL